MEGLRGGCSHWFVATDGGGMTRDARRQKFERSNTRDLCAHERSYPQCYSLGCTKCQREKSNDKNKWFDNGDYEHFILPILRRGLEKGWSPLQKIQLPNTILIKGHYYRAHFKNIFKNRMVEAVNRLYLWQIVLCRSQQGLVSSCQNIFSSAFSYSVLVCRTLTS